jgi:ribosomal protein S18 acetylase RimI-like enzyme
MSDDAGRAFAFMLRGDMAGTTAEETPIGTVVRSSLVPLRQDSNYLLVDRTELSAARLAAQVRRAKVRVLVVRDEETGERLVDGFDRLLWQTHRHVVMAHRRPADRLTDTSPAVEVTESELRDFRRAAILAAPWGRAELAEQLLRAKQTLGERLTTRFFAVRVGGEVVAATDLYLDGEEAQVEDVLTLEQHRNRGYASALVVRAVEEARASGATFVFLVALADDWPRKLYERLGFETVGGYYKFFL